MEEYPCIKSYKQQELSKQISKINTKTNLKQTKMSAVITTQQQQTLFKVNMRSAIKNAVKARNAKRRLHKRSLKDTLKELRKTTKKVAATSTSTSIKKKPAKKAGKKKPAKKKTEAGDKRIYRMMEKLIMKKGKQVKAKVWRSEKLYNLKAGEKWLDIWAIDTRKPTKGSHIRVESRPTIVEEKLVTIVDIAAADDMVEAAQVANEVVEAAKILVEA